MLSDEYVKSCFASDDEEEEKFIMKNKKERKIFYNPNSNKNLSKPRRKNKNKNRSKKDINKNKNNKNNISIENNPKIFNSDNSLIPIEKKISLDISKFKLEQKKYHIEYDYGNVEYKLKLCDVTVKRIQELTSQMNYRLREGSGECYYEIGVEDNGNTLGINSRNVY